MTKQALCKKMGVYLIGLFLLAVAAVLAIHSGLGVSPVNALPYTISIVSGLPLSVCVILVYCAYVGLQFIIRRKVEVLQLLQIVSSVVFSFILYLIQCLMGDISLPGYGGGLLLLAGSIVLTGIGVALYAGTGLVPLPAEGVALALGEKLGRPLSTTKNIMDCASVGAALLLSLLALGHVEGVREGTVISALLVGRVVALWNWLMARRRARASGEGDRRDA